MEASRLAAIATAHLPTPCVVMGATRAPDGSGGYTSTLVLKETTMCGLSGGVMQGDIAAEVAAKLQGRNAYRFRLPADTLASVGDEIVVIARRFELLSLAVAPGATLARGLAAEV